MTEPTSMAARMERKLTEAFAPTRLTIVDDSHKHAGHSGWREGGETHFRVEIVSAAFAGQSRVARQRAVYAAVAEELGERVHALQLRTATPEEAERA
jgi:BolA protein